MGGGLAVDGQPKGDKVRKLGRYLEKRCLEAGRVLRRRERNSSQTDQEINMVACGNSCQKEQW